MRNGILSRIIIILLSKTNLFRQPFRKRLSQKHRATLEPFRQPFRKQPFRKRLSQKQPATLEPFRKQPFRTTF
jgi:hypothetical protein